MYKIKSVVGGKILIGDLNLTILEDQEVDLDNLFSRDHIEKSGHLRRAIEKSLIVVTHKDVFVTSGLDHNALRALEDRLRQEILAQSRPPATVPHPQQHVDLDEKFSQLLSAIKDIKSAAPQQSVPEPSVESHITNETQVDIHTRTVERLRKNAEGRVESKQEIIDSDVSKKADELDGML
jgi:hypothetical protein